MSRVNKAKPPPYELVGVLVHQGGTCESGHYLAYVKCHSKWYKANDSGVSEARFVTGVPRFGTCCIPCIHASLHCL